MIATVLKDNSVSNKGRKSLLEVTKTSVRQTFFRISRGLLFTNWTYLMMSMTAIELMRPLLGDYGCACPTEAKVSEKKSPPFMNSELHGVIYKKKMLFNES